MATVASQLTRINDVEGSLTLTSIGGGAGGSANAEIVIQGAQSAGRKQSNSADHGFWLTVTSADVSGAGVHAGIWINHVHYGVLTKLAARLGSDTSNYEEHAFPLAAYPSTGGWVRFWFNVGRTPEASGGTLSKAALTQVAVLASLPAVSGNAPNLIMDAQDFTTGGLLLTGTAGVFQDFVSADEGNGTNKYGVVTTNAGVIFCLARLTLGSASSLVLNDSSFVIVFPNQSTVASSFMGISVDLQHASTDVDWSNGVVKSAGAVKGDLVVTGISGAFDVADTTLSGLRVITLTSACALNGCLISGCGLINAAGAALLGCTVTGATGPVALLWDTATNTNSKLDDTTFVSGGTGHAIELGPNTPATIALSGVGFSGYGADDTTDAAIYNNSGKAIEISILGGGDVPTVRNGPDASTVVVTGQRNFGFTVADASGNPVTGYEWRLYDASAADPGELGTELDGEESAAQSQQNYSYTYASDTPVVIQVMHSDFIEATVRSTLIDADRDVAVILLPEENV